MERKPYTVENNRPRRPTRLYGRTLAKKGLGRTSCLDLTEEELLGAPCVRLLQLNRLVLVRGDMPDALVELLSPPEEEVETTPAAVTPDVPASPPVQPDPPSPAPEPEPEPQPEPTPVVEPEPEPEEPAAEPEAPSLQDVSYVWDEASLFALNATEQKVILKSRDLKVSGKEADRVQRILDAQGGE